MKSFFTLYLSVFQLIMLLLKKNLCGAQRFIVATCHTSEQEGTT